MKVLHCLVCFGLFTSPAAASAQDAPSPPAPEATLPPPGASAAAQGPTGSPPVPVDVRIPRVWIFNGTPGDDEHHLFYEQNLASLRKSLTERFAIPPGHITVLYGPKSAGYDGPCTREALLAELGKITAHLQQPDASPAWVILQGHANAITGGAMFNLPGPDVSARETGDALKAAPAGAPLVVLATTACSAPFLRSMAAPGRFIVSATSPSDRENETEFPAALAGALAGGDSDANGDGILTLTELFQATTAGVLKRYEAGNFIVKEHAELDGDGDGRGTQRPSPEDAGPASAIGLKTAGGTKRFD